LYRAETVVTRLRPSDSAPKFHDGFDELIDRLPDDYLFAADEKERGVRRRVDPADVVRVDCDKVVV
jgi:hypothetical protein